MVQIDRKANHLDSAVAFIEGLKSDNPIINTILGECYLEQNKRDLAATALDKAIAANSPRVETYIDRAKLFIAAGKPDQALDMLKKGAAMAPSDLRAPLTEAELLGNLGNIRKPSRCMTIFWPATRA